MSYYQIILKVLEIADKSPELIDFYWPQLLHIHTLESAHRTPSSLMKLGEIEGRMNYINYVDLIEWRREKK
jgi:hypothetical protein